MAVQISSRLEWLVYCTMPTLKLSPSALPEAEAPVEAVEAGGAAGGQRQGQGGGGDGGEKAILFHGVPRFFLPKVDGGQLKVAIGAIVWRNGCGV